jgi:GntP family gluconate:H+ symporter
VGRFFEMDEKTTKIWTVMETLLGTIGFGLALIGSWLL